ncbi:MAG TPA: LamG-like jellyroll fold domain-containing protein, partial [Gaiellaceae bacterium]|nr:LamG-like jellyroll fold domain-containing protein [Gaiellaceae bacterium]
TVSTDGQWHHGAFTCDGTAAAAETVLYRDGAAVVTNPDGGWQAIPTAWNMGRTVRRGYLAGDLAHVAIFERALSGLEIADHFAAGEISSERGSDA